MFFVCVFFFVVVVALSFCGVALSVYFSFVIIFLRKRDLLVVSHFVVFLPACGCQFPLSLPHGAIG